MNTPRASLKLTATDYSFWLASGFLAGMAVVAVQRHESSTFGLSRPTLLKLGRPTAKGNPRRPLRLTASLLRSKNRTPLLVAVQEESEGLPTPAVESGESEPAILHSNDFVLLTDGMKCWIVRIEDISLLEACLNYTLVHFS